MRWSASLILCLHLSAQSFVVDAAGNGNFLDLPAAIAAVPSGAVLRVRPGQYSSFKITNKSLTILGDNPVTVVVDLQGGVQIGPIAINQKVIVQGVRFTGGPITAPVNITDAAGQVILDQITHEAPGPLFFFSHQLVILRCPNVHISGSTFSTISTAETSGLGKVTITDSAVAIHNTKIEANPGGLGWSTYLGNPGLSASNSFVFCTSVQATGSFGAGAGGCGLPTAGPNVGGPGVLLTAGSILHAVGCSFTGGVGGSGIPCRPSGTTGGPGIDVQQGLLRAIGTTLAGGLGGTTGGANGPASKLGAGGTIESPPLPVGLASLKGTPVPGQPVTLSISARAGDLAIAALAYDQCFLPYPYLITTGALLVAPVIVLGPFVVPATGTLDIPLQLPPTWPIAQWIPCQFLTTPATLTELWAANSFGILAH